MGRSFWGVILCCLCMVSLMIVPACGDLIAPAITQVYFEKDGMPYHGSVDYSVNCYGYSRLQSYAEKPAGSYQPELVYHYSASCKEYGCEIYQPYYLQYTHIDWCDLEGTTASQMFVLRNFSTLPYTICAGVPRRVEKTWGNTREYYYDTPEAFACRGFVNNKSMTVWADRLSFTHTVPVNSSQILPLQGLNPFYATQQWSHLIINKTDITIDRDQYIDYLKTCDPITDKKCSGWIVDGKPLKLYSEYRPLKNNATHLEDHPCDTFLVAADPSLIMPFTERNPWNHACVYGCNYTMQICEDHFSIPSGNLNGAPSVLLPISKRSQDAGSAPENIVVGIQPAPSPYHRSPVEFLYCSIAPFFGASC